MLLPVLQRIALKMFQGIEVEVDVKVLPPEMMAMEQPHAMNGGQAGFFKPWKLRVGKEIFPPVRIQPDAIGRNTEDLNG